MGSWAGHKGSQCSSEDADPDDLPKPKQGELDSMRDDDEGRENKQGADKGAARKTASDISAVRNLYHSVVGRPIATESSALSRSL